MWVRPSHRFQQARAIKLLPSFFCRAAGICFFVVALLCWHSAETCFVLSVSSNTSIVISTEAAHAIVSRAVEKSASLPRPPHGERLASPFSLLSFRRNLLFILPFSAQKSHVKPPSPPQQHKTQQPRTFRASSCLANPLVEPGIIEIVGNFCGGDGGEPSLKYRLNPNESETLGNKVPPGGYPEIARATSRKETKTNARASRNLQRLPR
jgi:hypothetical protein